MAKAIGPTFAAELAAAGLTGLPFSWSADGTITFGDDMTTDQIGAVEAVYAAHDPTKQDPQQAYAAAIAAGLAIVSTGTPAVSATYGIRPQDEINMTGLQVAVGAGVFPGYCRDIAGTRRSMTAPQFTALATAILNYVAALDDAYAATIGGAPWSAPTQPSTIA